MATQVQLRGGTTSEHSSFTGAAREVTVDTDKDVVVVHDGSTAGGIPLATEANLGTTTSTADAALPKAGGTMTGDVTFADNVYAKFGTNYDLRIRHDGSHSYIAEMGTGNLIVQTNGADFLVENTDGDNMINAISDGAVELSHNNVKKFETTSTGVDVTGSVTCDGFTSTGIDDNATSTAITIDASENTTFAGRVGVGTTPAAGRSIDVLGQSGYDDLVQLTGVGTNIGARINMTPTGTGISRINATANSLALQTSGAAALTLDSSQNVTVNTGNLVIGTSGKGIDFSAVSDGSRSVSSNILDDYEEGTWTPGITFGGTFDGTYDGQVGNYTKIGDLVTVSCFVDLGTKGTTTGAALLTGLPFTTNTTALTYSAPSFYINTVSFADMIVGFATYNGTTVIIREVTNAGSASNLDNTNFTDTSHVIMNLSYRV